MKFSVFGVFFMFYQVEAASLWYYESEDYHTITPLKSPLGLLDTPFNVNIRTVIFAFGYNGKVNGKETLAVLDAYMEYKKDNPTNFIVLDWEKEASSNNTGSIIKYPTGIHNAKKIGCLLGDALVELSEHGLDLDNVHLIGHSLGAHLVGHAGKRTQQKGTQLLRITGLDPAGPLFTDPIDLVRGLESIDAFFVDVLHTDPQHLGTSESIGDVDIWANCDLEYQPGCSESKVGCSHVRSAIYFAESVNYPSSLAAVSAESCHDWSNGDYNESDILYLGIPYNSQAKGDFFLRTNSKSPYGKGIDGIHP
ncbi:phospholipase A1 VesT1.02-like [Pieris rapae]|uniref:phospholipase A1 VesT1.02-like n=1 Tax=Pieris rapae TaxID=64459 RepID=UPI001E27EB0B|nr:phospholipase A1 VesT1.02-like [Pieris rapae]